MQKGEIQMTVENENIVSMYVNKLIDDTIQKAKNEKESKESKARNFIEYLEKADIVIADFLFKTITKIIMSNDSRKTFKILIDGAECVDWEFIRAKLKINKEYKQSAPLSKVVQYQIRDIKASDIPEIEGGEYCTTFILNCEYPIVEPRLKEFHKEIFTMLPEKFVMPETSSNEKYPGKYPKMSDLIKIFENNLIRDFCLCEKGFESVNLRYDSAEKSFSVDISFKWVQLSKEK